MFFFRKLFGLLFMGFLLFGVLGFFGRASAGRYHSAYQQGFIAGQQAAAGGSEAAAASSEGAAAEGAEGSASAAAKGYNYPGANVYWRGHGFFFPGFGLLFCLIPFFFLGLLFMGFGKRRHWHGHHRHRGPCGHGSWKDGPRRHDEDWVDSSQEKSPGDIDDGPDEPIMRA